jgi:hypothetical protein
MRRLVISTAAALLVLQALAPIGVAAKPTIIDVNDSFVDNESCGFPITTTTTGMLVVVERRGSTGQIVSATVGADYRVTFTGPTGRSLTLGVAGLQEESFSGMTLYFSFSGKSGLIVIPGVGIVLRDVGRFEQTLTFNPVTGEIVSFTETFHGRRTGLSQDQFCAYLAP